MEKLTEFVSRHSGDDVTRLVLDRAKWPEIDMDLAVNCIESRRKLKGKVQEWYEETGLIFPKKLSAEQCSSSATGKYKMRLAEKILSGNESRRIADLTGGLGVDSWFFSKISSEVLYCEMLPELCEAARHNFTVLGAENITVRNCAVSSETASQDGNEDGRGAAMTPEMILNSFNPNLVYMDPARRGEGGKKVFLIEDCTPDVLTLKDEIFRFCQHLLIKLSPMADITMVCERLGNRCREVHVVASGGECKELLIWMDKEWADEYTIKAVELHDGNVTELSFKQSEERNSHVSLADKKTVADLNSYYLFEPGKALMKAGAFNLICNRFGNVKLGRSTHYYIISEAEFRSDTLKGLGKVFKIIESYPLDKKSIRLASTSFPRAEVTARNIPMDTETLRKKLGVTSSDDTHIFGLKSDICGNLLLCTQRMF